MKRKIQFKTVKSRLTFWFLIVALLPLIVICKINYDLRVKAIKNREISKLTAIRDLKIQQVNSWLDTILGNVQTIAEDYRIKALETIFMKEELTQDEMNTINNIKSNLVHYIEYFKDFFDIFIINSHSGKVELSTDNALEKKIRSKRSYFTEPLRTGKIYISDIFFSEYLDKPSLILSIPIYCLAHNNKHIIGILAARINLEESLYALLMNRTGMGKTGETLIVNKNGIALNELRWYKKAPLRLKIKAQSAKLALEGDIGIIEATDYRGEKVLSAYGHLSRTGWGFIAKQDLTEIYTPIKLIFRNMLILLLVTSAFVYMIVILVTRNITRPIIDITAVAKRIEEGDISARNHIQREDEFGYQALSFNKMADSIMSYIRVKEGSADIDRAMVSAKQLKDFGMKLLDKLIEISNSNFAVFYVCREDDGKFEPLISIGANLELKKPFDAEKCEGEFEKVLATKKISHLKHIPEDTVFTFKTFVGTVHPREIITIPLIVEEKVRGIISLASLVDYTKESLEILNQSFLGISIALSNQLANEEMQRLSEELKFKNMQLETQTEELEAQAVELQMQSEKLQQQSEELQAQNMELEAQKLKVEEANHLKSVFLSNMSHELRTPLNSIMALSRVLITDASQKLSQKEKKYLEVIESNGKNLLTLINNILDLSKIEAGAIEVNLSLFSLASTIETVVERLEPIANEKGLKINQDIPANLPLIESDEAIIHQILQNIIGNAVKFTEQGSINISVYCQEQKVYIKVADTGIGIEKEGLQNIFKEFRQVDSSLSSQYDGTGLGLAIAFKSAKILEGEIFAESTLGEGSIFTLALPIEWQKSNEEHKSPDVTAFIKDQTMQKRVIEQIKQYPQSAEVWKVKGRKNILLIEDNEVAVVQVKMVLENEGYSVDVARSGKEALDYIRQRIPDGIILDLMMPEVDGFEVLEKIRSIKATAKVPVLILTAKDLTKGDLMKLKANNIQQLIQKGNVNKEGLLIKTRLMFLEDQRIRSEGFNKKALSLMGKKKDLTILIIEDNFDNRITIRSIIKDKYKILEATDGEEGLEMTFKHLPDLILLDIKLPRMDGLTVVRRIKNDKKTCRIPVIALTAHAMKGDSENIIEAGCDDYISKPVDPEHLLSKINGWIN